jgi:predicted nucleotidyltransferase
MKAMMNKPVGEIIQEYKEGLKPILGKNLLDVFIYGSHARGEATVGSDVDILCVMKHPFNYGGLISDTSELTAAISLKYDVILSRVFVTKADFDGRQLPFFMNVRKDSIAV